ncbi:MAG TPA: HAMP domain-containing protein [Steroidobacteraceae bacterium]|jgi:two-component system sensor histidine kinase UhpB
MLWIATVLIATLVFGGVLVYWHAIRKVDTEMSAAIEVGRNTVNNAVDDLGETPNPERQLRLLVADFDGDRHLRAKLIAADGAAISQSTPLRPADAPPLWFHDLLARPAQSKSIRLPAPFDGYGSIELVSDSHNELAEVWSDVVLTLTLLTTFCALNAGLVYLTTGRALRPLNEIVTAFAQIGGGDYTQHVPEHGPQELEALARGLNKMVARLGEMEMRKRRLEEQLVEVQEEERSELARDLHDEVGPLLFAISVDLVAVEQQAARYSDTQLQQRLEATRDALTRIQQQVRDLLGRLRPLSVVDLGLGHSIQRLVAFWRTRYPAVEFAFSSSLEQDIDEDLGLTIYKIVQESLSNALRHGKPAAIGISIAEQQDHSLLIEVCDDGVGLRGERPRIGLGLTSMRERVSALRGELNVGGGPDGRGVLVSARLPGGMPEAQGAEPVDEERPA